MSSETLTIPIYVWRAEERWWGWRDTLPDERRSVPGPTPSSSRETAIAWCKGGALHALLGREVPDIIRFEVFEGMPIDLAERR